MHAQSGAYLTFQKQLRIRQALPQLLEKCVERGWRTVVQTGRRISTAN